MLFSASNVVLPLECVMMKVNIKNNEAIIIYYSTRWATQNIFNVSISTLVLMPAVWSTNTIAYYTINKVEHTNVITYDINIFLYTNFNALKYHNCNCLSNLK